MDNTVKLITQLFFGKLSLWLNGDHTTFVTSNDCDSERAEMWQAAATTFAKRASQQLRCRPHRFCGIRVCSSSAHSSNNQNTVTVTKVEETPGDASHVTFTFSDGSSFTRPSVWVRDHCQCPTCVSQDTLQRLTNDAVLMSFAPEAHHLQAATVRPEATGDDNESVTVQWKQAAPTIPILAAHHSADTNKLCPTNKFSHTWLVNARDQIQIAAERSSVPRSNLDWSKHDITPSPSVMTLWDAEKYTDLETELGGSIQFEALADKNHRSHHDTVRNLVQQLRKLGIVFIENVPKNMEGTVQMVESFAVPRSTVWGHTWGTTVETSVEKTMSQRCLLMMCEVRYSEEYAQHLTPCECVKVVGCTLPNYRTHVISWWLKVIALVCLCADMKLTAW